MGFGRWQHFPIFFGRNDTWKLIHESYRETHGTVLGNETVAREAKIYARSRALYVAYNQSKRVDHLWNPHRMVFEILERWEKVMGLSPTGTRAQRRNAVAERFRMFGIEGTHQAMTDLARSIAGDLFDGIVYHDPADVAALGPSYVAVPGGVTGSGHLNYEDGEWRSGVYSIVVKLDQGNVSLGELRRIGAQVVEALSNRFAAYLRITWSRTTGTGFILGESLLGVDPMLTE